MEIDVDIDIDIIEVPELWEWIKRANTRIRGYNKKDIDIPNK